MGVLIKRILNRLDGMILFLLLIFMVISIFCIYSATWKDPEFVGSHNKMMYFYGLGFAVIFAMMFINYKLLLRFAPLYYLIGVALLVFLYFKGTTLNNAQGWFTLPGGLSFQPAELCKLLLILFLAYFLTKRDVETLSLLKEVLPMGVITLVPFVLVLMQPDLGNAIGYVAIFLAVCWIGHIRYSHALAGLLVIVLVGGTSLYGYITYHEEVKQYMASKNKEYWLDRIDAVLLPDQASAKATYHMSQSVIAIGSGSLKGDGYLQGTSVQRGHVPYTYSDSIFVVVGEEFGFLGASVLLMLYFLLIYRMMVIALNLTTKSGIYIILGTAAMFLYQIFENVGMLIGIMPITGITLPFISYGGTSLMINMIAIGLVLNIKIYDDVPVEEKLTLGGTPLHGG
ncbi:FtsW/RodA/SpoVE family cell cycle protein [Paenibacillus xerothermodurans]|uniref:Rod shape-determining protein RodA n=1 Tax=Paenibacillus xerothermodurans TaxID=1977292 RepID=A0A2W1NR86_PAEXE|nr:FtsW/RodA/SpoVE family cell cycle protein [Paenibacillus xerothermodurans]PZE20246.1 rod shape-determining protein RodA [Paenibacillus xerothermodurans]